MKCSRCGESAVLRGYYTSGLATGNDLIGCTVGCYRALVQRMWDSGYSLVGEYSEATGVRRVSLRRGKDFRGVVGLTECRLIPTIVGEEG